MEYNTEFTDTLENFDRLVSALRCERELQREMWGQQTHPIGVWLAILGEEYGEACKAVLEKNKLGLYLELIQTAAVALSIASGIYTDKEIRILLGEEETR